MAKYEKPMVIANDELAEGVFAASGCYTVTWKKHQDNQEGRTSQGRCVIIKLNVINWCKLIYMTDRKNAFCRSFDAKS